MSIFSIFMIAVGLSMDAFAVSLARAMTIKKQDLLRYALILGLSFGFFQGFMPFIGWWAGSYFQEFIVSIDHWIAFILLALIGGNMIKEAFQNEDEEEEERKTSLTLKTILILSIATSIDAFAVGISFAFLQVNILSAVLLIGITTFVICFIGVFIGNRLGNLLGKYAEILGGGILILIGLKILIEHLFG